jgi:glycolate oxidase
MEKNELMPYLFAENDLNVMLSLRRAFDPQTRFNPLKLFPTPRSCREGTFSSVRTEVGAK